MGAIFTSPGRTVTAGVVLIMAKGGGSPARAEGPRLVEAGPALPITESGWIMNWAAGEAGVRKTRDISVLRASLNLTDYRVDLQGQIETKGMGWIVRAMNAKNFCVLRLEIIKPGLEPVVNFVRFSMVGGEEQSRLSLRLPFPVRIDTMYKIRTEVVEGTSALFLVTEDADLDKLGERFRFNTTLITTNLTDEERATLLETFGGG
jgi:hypothetical protein